MTRNLTQPERNALLQFSSGIHESQREQFICDLENCKVEEHGVNGSRLIFELAGYSRPPYRGQHSYLVEGKILDQDGVDVSVWIYADENERLFELEFVKWSDVPIKGLNWNSFHIAY